MASKSEVDLQKVVAEAEAAVASVKDPELRRVAFEKILSSLLDANRKPVSTKSTASRGAKKAKSPEAEHSPRGPIAYIEEIIEDEFFSSGRTIAEVKAELANRGHHIPLTSLSGPLQRLTQRKRLRRQKTRANGDGTKSTYSYSNW